MAERSVEPEELMVGFVYSVVYRGENGKPLILEGELLSFDELTVEIKAPKGSVNVRRTQITTISRK